MIDVDYLASLLTDLIDIDSTQHAKWAALNARIPEEVKAALILCRHVHDEALNQTTNDQGASMTALLGGLDMGGKYLLSVSMQQRDRMRFVRELPALGKGIEPALAAAYLLVCSPTNAHATIRRLGEDKYELPFGPCGPVAEDNTQ